MEDEVLVVFEGQYRSEVVSDELVELIEEFF